MIKTFSKFCLGGCLVWLPVDAGAQTVAPKPLTTSDPGYPASLTDTGIDGLAEVDVTIKTDGSVADPQLAVATQRAFGKTALASVVTWRFTPGTRDGVPVDMQVTVPFVFKAPDDQLVNAVVKRKVFVKLENPVLSQHDYDERLKLKTEFHPLYPRSLANEHTEVTVEVSFVVAPDGSTLNPTVMGSPRKEFIIPALVAVARAAYAPPMKNGQGVYVQTSTKLDFENYPHDSYGGGGGMPSGGGGGGRH